MPSFYYVMSCTIPHNSLIWIPIMPSKKVKDLGYGERRMPDVKKVENNKTEKRYALNSKSMYMNLYKQRH